MASFSVSSYHKYVDLQNVSSSGDPASAPTGGIYLFASGTQGSAKLYVQNEGDSTPTDIVGGSSLTISDGNAQDTVTVGTDTLTISGSTAAISASVADNQIQMHLDIAKLAATTTVDDSDLIVIDDGAGGTIRKMTRANFIESAALDNINIDGGAIDGVTLGTNAAVTDSNFSILTASNALITNLDVVTINSVSQTETTLEITDKLIVAALSASSANASDGGLQIGGGADSDGHAAILWDNGNTALDFSIGGTTEVRLEDGVFRAETNNDVDLGTSAAGFKNLYLVGAASVGSLSVNDGNITNVGDIALDSISADDNDMDITLTDNRAAALEIKEGSTAYMTFVTTNGQEEITADKTFIMTAGGNVGDDQALSFGDDDDTHVKYVSASDSLEISGTFVTVSGTTQFMQAVTIDGGLSVSDQNITNVGDIALDSISADGTDIDITLTDNSATALEIKEGSTSYMTFVTSNGQEEITVGKEMTLSAGALVNDDQVLGFGNDDDALIKFVSASDALEMSGSEISISGTVTFNNDVEFSQGASFGDQNITNVGDINVDSVSADGTDFDLLLTDNEAAALEIKEGSNAYMTFVTTNGQEEISVAKEMTLKAGALLEDDQTLTFGNDDDGSIQFVSADNVVRLDGGSSGLNLNDTTAFGVDGTGVNVTFHGGAANEQLVYTAADHTLKFVDGSSATLLTLGGDATGEFAIDVADGSNNQNKIRAAAFVTYSDERLKTDVTPIENSLETVNSLRAVNFTWKKDGSKDFGFMAQELKQVVPQAVHGSEEGLFGVDYGRLSAILVSAIQEQSAQIAALKKQLENK